MGGNVTDFCIAVLVDSQILESAAALIKNNLAYITYIFEDTSDSRLDLWETCKYKEVTEFIKKICVCDKYFM